MPPPHTGGRVEAEGEACLKPKANRICCYLGSGAKKKKIIPMVLSWFSAHIRIGSNKVKNAWHWNITQ